MLLYERVYCTYRGLSQCMKRTILLISLYKGQRGLVLGAEVRRRGLQPPDRWDASGALRSSQGA